MSGPVSALLAGATLVAAALLTGLMRSIAAGSGVVDIPKPRSSHGVPTPRGGGVAIVLVMSAGLVVLTLRGALELNLLCALGGGGLAVGLVGLADDRRSLSATTRLTVHFAAALWALAWLGGLPALRIGAHLISLGWTGFVLGALGIVWAVNLFNFMDGIDGLAASEGVFVASGGALLGVMGGSSGAIPAVGLTLASACAGFLLWNWPPAKIFMGDVGSGYLGYFVAVVALAAMRDKPEWLWVWLILGGVFFVDATVTLVRRLVRGERVYVAHRSHAYQCLARRWGSHRRVTIAVMVLNVMWLLPCAFLATLHADYAVAIVVVALVPLVALALAAGSGRRENGSSKAAMT